MLPIQKKASPLGLLALQQETDKKGLCPKNAYAYLKNSLKREVLEQLIEEQGHLCAYCMRKIPEERIETDDIPNVSIEHWFPRNPDSGENRGQALDYGNLLAVCSGNLGPKGKRKKSDLTCDAKRRNRELKINPLDAETLKAIAYGTDGKIIATDCQYADDLYVKLNLNCVSANVILPQNRKAVLDSVQSAIAEADEIQYVDHCKKLLSSFEAETDPKTPYIGIAIWWLKDFISKHS